MVAAAIEAVEMASAVDTVVEKVRLVAIEEMSPRKYFAVAMVAADIVDMGLVVVASFIPLFNLTQYTLNSVYICTTTQSIIVSNYKGNS